MEKTDKAAQEILQSVLDAGARALLGNDPDLFFSYIQFPHNMVTEDAEYTIKHRDALMPKFTSLATALKANGVTDFIRIAQRTRFLDADMICGDWITHVVRRDHRLIPPYPGRTRLVRNGDQWQMSHSAYGFRFPKLNGRLPTISDNPELRELGPA